MITHRTRGLYVLHFAAQTAAVSLLFWLWFYINFFWLRYEPEISLDRYAVYNFSLLVGLAVDFFRSGGSSQTFLDLSARLNRFVSLRQAITALLSLLLFVFAARDNGISRVFLFTYLPALYVLLMVTNRYVPRLLASHIFSGKRRQRTIVVGSLQTATRLDSWLQHKLRYGLETVGLVTDDFVPEGASQLPVLGQERELEQVLRSANAHQLLVAGLPTNSSRISELGQLCDRLGIHLLIMNDLEEHVGRRVSFVQDAGVRFLSLRDEPLECPFNRLLKRAVDVAISLPVVVFILPFTSLLVALCHRLQSEGPLIFKQLRTGINGDDFLIYKYRTMHVAPFDEAVQAVVGDVRVFRAGTWLRKLSIDELPQFINVLKGDMSIVGPRPHLKKHDDIFSSVAHSYRVRALIRPGITGLAQVRGHRGEARHDEEIVSRVDSDLFYLENWSLMMDTTIILKTALQMIFPPRQAV